MTFTECQFKQKEDHIVQDYKEMYLKMMRASEKAIRILIDAQQECEEIYLYSEESHGSQSESTEQHTQSVSD